MVFKVFDPVTGTYTEREMLPARDAGCAAPAPYTVPVSYTTPETYAAPSLPRNAPSVHRPVQPRSTVRVSTPRVRSSGSAIDSFARSAINSAGCTLGSTLTRGLLDTLGLGRKKRR